MKFTILIASVASVHVTYDSCVEGASMEVLLQTRNSFASSQKACTALIKSRASELGCKRGDNYWLLAMKKSYISGSPDYSKKDKAKKVAKCTMLRQAMQKRMTCVNGDSIEEIERKKNFWNKFSTGVDTWKLLRLERECNNARAYLDSKAAKKPQA